MVHRGLGWDKAEDEGSGMGEHGRPMSILN